MRRALLSFLLLLSACPPADNDPDDGGTPPVDSGVTIDGGVPQPDAGPGALTVNLSAPAQSSLITNAAVELTVVAGGAPQLVEILADGALAAALVTPPYTWTAQPPQVDSSVSYTARATRGTEQVTSTAVVVHFDRTAPAVLVRSPEQESGAHGLRTRAAVVTDDRFSPATLSTSSCSITIADGPRAGTALPFDLFAKDINPGTLASPGVPVLSVNLQARDAWPEDGGYVSQTVRLRASFAGLQDLAGNPLASSSFSWLVEPWQGLDGFANNDTAITLATTADGRIVTARHVGTTLNIDTDAESISGYTSPLNVGTSPRPQLAINAQGETVAGWVNAGYVHVARFTDGGWLEYSTDANPRTPQDAGLTAADFALALKPDGAPLVALRQSSGTTFHLREWTGAGFETQSVFALASAPDAYVLDLDGAGRPAMALSLANNVLFRRWTGAEWVSLSGTTATAADAPAISATTAAALSMVFDDQRPIIASVTSAGVTVVRETDAAPTSWTTLPSPYTSAYGLRLRHEPSGLFIGTVINGAFHVDRFDGTAWRPFAARYGTSIIGYDFALVTPASLFEPRQLLGPHTRTAVIIVHDATSTRVMRASR